MRNTELLQRIPGSAEFMNFDGPHVTVDGFMKFVNTI